MRIHKFILVTVCILLASVLAAGLAIRAVVAPRTGETISAGVLSIPSVLGHTAEEVLFDPWPMYEPQALFPLSENFHNSLLQAENSRLSLLLDACGLLGISYDNETLLGNLLWNVDHNQDPNRLQLFLKDFPAALNEGQTPVILDFAMSQTSPSSISYLVWPPETYRITETEEYLNKTTRSSISYVVRPLEACELTEEQRQAALSNVKSDLAKCMLSADRAGNGLAELLFSFSEYYEEWKIEEFFLPIEQLRLPFPYSSVQGMEFDLTDTNALEKVLVDQAVASPGTVQLITTPQQIVVLLDLGNGSTLGIYYDIQLERYSGFGMSF